MYNYFLILGNVKSVIGNILTVISTRPFPEPDGTRKQDEFKFELKGALYNDTLISQLEVCIPLGIKGSLIPDGDRCITRVERLIFPEDRRMDMQLDD